MKVYDLQASFLECLITLEECLKTSENSVNFGESEKFRKTSRSQENFIEAQRSSAESRTFPGIPVIRSRKF